jgi:hypothetical protein
MCGCLSKYAKKKHVSYGAAAEIRRVRCRCSQPSRVVRDRGRVCSRLVPRVCLCGREYERRVVFRLLDQDWEQWERRLVVRGGIVIVGSCKMHALLAGLDRHSRVVL